MNDKIPISRTLHMYDVDGTVLCIYDQNDSLVVDVMDGQMSNDDARRMVACWNACDGIPTDRLEGVPMRKTTLGEMFGAFAEVSRRRIEASMYEETCANFETEILSLKSKLDDLLMAAKAARSAIGYESHSIPRLRSAFFDIDSAIIKLEGGAA